jgi:hypothetical protein
LPGDQAMFRAGSFLVDHFDIIPLSGDQRHGLAGLTKLIIPVERRGGADNPGDTFCVPPRIIG